MWLFSLQNSYLWKIDVDPPVYLFGTMHVPYTTLWDYIPENVKTAFSSSEELCLELQMLNQDTFEELSECRKLPSDASLESMLSAETIERITSYLERVKAVLPRWLDYEESTGGNFFLSGRPSRYWQLNYIVPIICKILKLLWSFKRFLADIWLLFAAIAKTGGS